MSSMDRARTFLARKVGRIALSIVPLAAATLSVSPVHAGTVRFAPSGCSTSPANAGQCFVAQNATSGTDPNANWLQLYGDASYSGSAAIQGLGFSGSGTAFVSGGTYSGLLPLTWDFFISSTAPGSGGGIVNWTVDFSTGGLCNNVDGIPGQTSFTSCGSAFTQSGTVAIGTNNITNTAEVRGSGQLNEFLFTNTSYNISVNIDSGNTPVSTLELNVPGGGTLDLNPTPEPAAFLLSASGLAGLFLFRRRKNRA